MADIPGQLSTGGVVQPVSGRPGNVPAASATPEAQLLRVLLVDDNPPTLDFLTELFSAHGSLVSPAATAEQALDLLSDHEFDLVVADIMLPGLSGLDLLRAVKGGPSETPVVLITGLPSVNSAVFGLRYGAYDYLSKPFSVAEVQRLLQRVRTDRERGIGHAPPGLREEVARRQLGMEGLFRIGALALADVDPGALVDTLLDYTLQGLRSQAALLVLRDQDENCTPLSRGRAALVDQLRSLSRAAFDQLVRAGGTEVVTLAGPEQPVVALATALPMGGTARGLLCVGRDRQSGAFLPDETEFLRAYAQTAALALQKTLLRDQAESEPIEIMSVFVTALESLESKDPSLRGHSARVSLYAGEVALALGLPRAQVAVTRRAGLLHDLGKLALPDAVLLKPGSLTTEEYALVQRHPVMGGRILRRLPVFVDEAEAVEHHLERYDGSGHPGALTGDAIPLAARILSVADAFDAMTSPRPYRPALSQEATLDELTRSAGTQFDPAVVQAFAAVPRARLTEIARYYGARPGGTPAPAPPEPSPEALALDPIEPRDVAVVPEPPVSAEADQPDASGPAGAQSAGAVGAAGLEEMPLDRLRAAEAPADQDAPPPQPAGIDQALLIVARGHRDLLEELRTILGDAIGPVRVIEDRRRDQTILPREGRQGRPHVDWEIDVAEGEGPTPQDPAPAP